MSSMLDRLPSPPERRVSLRVTPDAERRLRQGHPWLYDQAIRKQSHQARAGELAVVYDGKNRFLAIGLYDPHSPIRVRVLQAGAPAPIDPAWFQARLSAAIQRRAALDRTDTTGYRLVYGESDGLPGLVLDRYDQTLVLKLYTAAWVAHLRSLVAALESVCPAQRLILRFSRAAQQHRAALHGLADGTVLLGRRPVKPVVFRENGLRFEVDPLRGQKTGFFLDQRDNRGRLGSLAAGRTVLDAFAYTGGFSVYAAAGGAKEVVSLDASRPALEAARRHMALNRDYAGVAHARHETIVGDVFECLDRLRRDGRVFDIVVLDPPAFAKAKQEVPAALKSHATLTRLALGVLAPDGILMQSCCSGQVSPGEFYRTVYEAAAGARRHLRDIARPGHPLDHPVRFPEARYLKCLFARATGRAQRR